MQGILYEQSGWSFLVLTLAIGGAAAYLTGRAVAKDWRPAWTLVVYVALLGLRDRPRLSGQGAARNAMCPCGSGRKFKRCCGAVA